MVMIIELLLLFDGWNAGTEKLDTVSYLRSLLVNFSFLAVELYSFDKIQAKCCLFQIKYTRGCPVSVWWSHKVKAASITDSSCME